MKKTLVLFLVILGAATLTFSALAWMQGAGARVAEHLDQAQSVANYGFVFSDQTTRWQEFLPTCDALTGVELLFSKFKRPNGSDWPGNAIVEIRTLSDTVLAHTVILSPSIVNNDWTRVSYSPTVPISAGVRYRIAVYSDRPNSTDAWVAWRGALTSTYPCTACLNDVINGWPNYDYAFRTYCPGARIYLPLVARQTP